MGVRLKNPWRECPPGGFVVNIGKVNKTEQFWSFREAIAWYRGIALANPSLKLTTDDNAIAKFVDQQNALRVMGIPGGEYYVLKGGPVQTQETKKATLFQPVVAVGDKVKQLVAGAAILADWVGAGAHPVEADIANSRAAICATCPQNGLGNLTRWFTVFASETIRKQIETAQALKLTTSFDEKLGVCAACLCPLKLKVHVPLSNIKSHLSATVRESLDPRCWITK